MRLMQLYGGPLDGLVMEMEPKPGACIKIPLSQEKIRHSDNFEWPVYIPSDYGNLGTATYECDGAAMMFTKSALA